MGLDIYLKRFDDFADTRRREREHDEESERIWGRYADRKYEDMTESEKTACRQQIAEAAVRLGLDPQWGCDESNVEKIELPSKKYPDHLFKIGYFRSSYNHSGINGVLARCGLPDLYHIFPHDDSDCYFRPDWQNSRARALSVAERLSLEMAIDLEPVYDNPLGKPTTVDSIEKARRIVVEQLEENETTFGAWSTRDGIFYKKEPLEVVGFVHGFYDWCSTKRLPCTYVAYKMDFSTYVQSLEIIAETCDWVLAQDRIDQYYLWWSS